MFFSHGCIDEQTQAQSRLVLLFQFLRLRSLFAPNQPSSFAPPVLPPAVASATGQEVAAVHTLFDEFSNGPLLGGNGDALEKLEKIATGSQDAVIEGVTCERSTTKTRADQTWSGSLIVLASLCLGRQSHASSSSSTVSRRLRQRPHLNNSTATRTTLVSNLPSLSSLCLLQARVTRSSRSSTARRRRPTRRRPS